MKTVYQPVSLERTVRFAYVSQTAFMAALTDTAVMSLRQRADFSLFTMRLRALGILASRLEQVVDPGSDPGAFLDAIRDVGLTFGRLAQAFTLWITQERAKILRGWVAPEIVADAVTAMLGVEGQALISDAQTYDLILHAVPGVGPELSHDKAAAVIGALLKYLTALETTNTDTTLSATARLAAIALTAYIQDAMAEPTKQTSFLTAGKTDAMLEIRVTELRKMAAHLLGIGASATSAVARHFITWLKDPWVMKAAIGRTADALMRVTEEFEMRSPSEGPFSGLSINLPDTYDRDIVNLEGFFKQVTSRGTDVLPSAESEFFHPLAADIHFPLTIKEDDVANWVEVGWTLTRRAELWATDLEQFGDQNAPTIHTKFIPANLLGEGGIAGISVAPGIPLVSDYDPSVLWATSRWSIRSLDLDLWQLQTRAHVINVMKNRPYTPVRITGSPASVPFAAFPTLQPMFADVDDLAPTLDPGFDALAVLWNSTPSRVRQYLASLQPSPDSVGWRSVAHALRFVGMISINGRIVQTFDRHWYHAESITDPDGKESGKEFALSDGPAKVTFKAFRAIPLSALTRDLPRSLALLDTPRPAADLPVLRWSQKETTLSKVVVRGWSIAPEGLVDIVLLQTIPHHFDLYVTGGQSGSPMGIRPYNVVLSVGDPVDPVQMPNAPYPTGANVMIP